MKNSLDSPLKALACDNCETLHQHIGREGCLMPFKNDETDNAIEMKDEENANGQGK